MRSGITVIFTVVIVLFTGSFFFKYPDVIVAKATITGNTPPANLKARISGKITRIFIADNQGVQKGEVLAIIENTCNYSDYLAFSKKLKMFKITNGVTEGFALSEAFGSENLQLGELQTYYSNFLKQIKDYRNFLEIDYHHKKIVSTEKQISEYQKYIQNLENQLLISVKDLKLQEKQFLRDSILYKRDVISAEEYGMLKGKISEISEVNDGENYTVKILLPNSMQTNYKIKIPFKQNMQASAEILTEELPLISRFFNPIKSLFLENQNS